MRRSSSQDRSRHGPMRRAASGMVLGAVLSVLSVTVVATSTAVPPAPSNPSDADLTAAGAQVDANMSQVSSLINQVAAANDELQRLDDEVATRREEVNKALVDLQNARDAADAAAAAVGTAQQALADAGTQIDQAQTRFDEYAARTYTQGNGGPASIASYFGAASPDEVLERAQMLDLLSKSQAQVNDGLQRARTEQANRGSAARQAKIDADAAAADAEAKKDEAEQAIATAQSALADQQARKAAVESERNEVQAQLDAARANVAGLQDQRDAYNQWDIQRQVEAALQAAAPPAASVPPAGVSPAGVSPEGVSEAGVPPAGVSEAGVSEVAAIVPVPQAGTAPQAGAPAGTVRPDVAALESQVALGPGMSPLAEVAAAAQRIAVEAASRLAADQAQRDRAAELATGQRPHTALEDEDYSDSYDEETGPQDSLTALEPSPNRPKSRPRSTVPSVTGPAAIEIVVNRGLSQLGVQYAWGGGDEDGPSRGIKDGGVGDAHGDYKKVGFDCSGLMIYAFAGVGISLPHYSGYQYTSGKQVPVSQRKRGDMLFWGSGGSQHVALYLGNGQMLEAPQSGDVVKISPVREGGIMPYAVRLV
ncbi:MAG TPA: NlpC/P60 family protein [Aldersonia sp.]